MVSDWNIKTDTCRYRSTADPEYNRNRNSSLPSICRGVSGLTCSTVQQLSSARAFKRGSIYLCSLPQQKEKGRLPPTECNVHARNFGSRSNAKSKIPPTKTHDSKRAARKEFYFDSQPQRPTYSFFVAAFRVLATCIFTITGAGCSLSKFSFSIPQDRSLMNGNRKADEQQTYIASTDYFSIFDTEENDINW